jgi:hypothetical protein
MPTTDTVRFECQQCGKAFRVSPGTAARANGICRECRRGQISDKEISQLKAIETVATVQTGKRSAKQLPAWLVTTGATIGGLLLGLIIGVTIASGDAQVAADSQAAEVVAEAKENLSVESQTLIREALGRRFVETVNSLMMIGGDETRLRFEGMNGVQPDIRVDDSKSRILLDTDDREILGCTVFIDLDVVSNGNQETVDTVNSSKNILLSTATVLAMEHGFTLDFDQVTTALSANDMVSTVGQMQDWKSPSGPVTFFANMGPGALLFGIQLTEDGA